MIEHRVKFTVAALVIIWIIILIQGMLHLYKDYVARTTGTITVQLTLPTYTPEPRKNLWYGEFTDDDEHCLALNIYFEARGEEDIRGKYAVADVVMYRWMHVNYPDDICDVVQDGHYHEWKPDLPIRHKCQFSWWLQA